ncbi:MAG TPA: phosphotransferase [Steroidobacteraceae bacterium]|nr:phosphotransferase [Steroidobacteraceae bacterium]
MLSDELKSVVTRHVPGQGKLDIHRLGHGLVNETYRVLRDGRTYALRAAAMNSSDLGLDRVWEARVLECAVAADLAPEITYCDPQRGILIARWVDGRLWSPADVRRQSNIARVAELMRRIHALAVPMPARTMSPAQWIEYYGAALARRGGVSAETAAEAAGTQGARGLSAAAARRLASLAALPGVDPAVCHSDLHTLNLVDRGDSLALLDWEYAHAADPFWDLAGWSANNDLEDDLERDLLASYTGRPPTHDEYLRLQLLGWLYDYVCLLWSELYLMMHGGEPQGVEIRGIAVRARLLAARLQ